MWEYTPDSSTGINEFQASSFEFQVSPNPAKEFIVISSEFMEKEKIEIVIADALVKKVFETQLQIKTLNFKLPKWNLFCRNK